MKDKKSQIKVAIVHDYLRTYGGGERVLEELHNIWPKAKIYVATADYTRMGTFANKFKGMDIETSWAQAFPFFVKWPILYRFILPFVWSTIKLGDADVVISSSGSNMSKGVRTPDNAIHICYCHTPPRFLYSLNTETPYLDTPWLKVISKPFINLLKAYDKITSKNVDTFIANSINVQKRIKNSYHRNSIVVYPPCNIPTKFKSYKKGDYFLVVSRLVRYKNIDLIIKAFNQNNLQLKIVGAGRDETKLRKLAGNNVEFLGAVSDNRLKELYAETKALLVATDDEDFGMTAAEAQGFGTPVIAFYSGGIKETVIESVNGIFFYHKTVKSLVNAIKKFNSIKFDQKIIWSKSQKFSKERFKRSIKIALEARLKDNEKN